MMIKLMAFQALLCLGAANELKLKDFSPDVHISKHAGNHTKAVKMGKWNGRRHLN